MAKPTKDTSWDTLGTNSTNPAGADHANGYADNTILPAAEYNYMLAAFGEWLAWLDRGVAAYTLISDGIEGTDADDTFVRSSDLGGWGRTTLETDARTGAAADRLLDCDGVYYVWSTWQTDRYSIRRLDDASEVVVIPSTPDVITSLMMDGERIWCITDADDIFCHDYTGSQLGTAALGSVGTLRDTGNEAALVSRTADRHLDVWDGTATQIATWDLGVGNSVDAALWHPLTLGGMGAIVHWQNAAVNTLSMRQWNGGALFSNVWVKATGYVGAIKRMWTTGETLRMVMLNITDSLYELVCSHVTPGNLPPGVGLLTAWASYVATPRFLIGYDAGGGIMEVWDWAGRSYGDQPYPSGADEWRAAVCDGIDPIVIVALATDDQVERINLGLTAPHCRRYDPDDWKPLCHSQGVAAIERI